MRNPPAAQPSILARCFDDDVHVRRPAIDAQVVHHGLSGRIGSARLDDDVEQAHVRRDRRVEGDRHRDRVRQVDTVEAGGRGRERLDGALDVDGEGPESPDRPRTIVAPRVETNCPLVVEEYPCYPCHQCYPWLFWKLNQ